MNISVSRRDFIKFAGVFAGAAVAGVPCSVEAAEACLAKPNVLLIIADDLAVRLGCYGDKVAKTPGLDRLASEGVLFERAYSQGVVCTPSRKSFLTGLSTKIVGAGSDNYMKAHPETMTVSRWFRQHGYQAIGIGKIEHTMDYVDPQGWDIRESNLAGENRGKVRNFLKASDDAPTHCSVVDVRPDDATTMDIERGKRLVSFWQKEWKREKPFFAALGFHTAHEPHDTQQRYMAMHPKPSMPLANTPEDATKPLAHSLPFPPIRRLPMSSCDMPRWWELIFRQLPVSYQSEERCSNNYDMTGSGAPCKVPSKYINIPFVKRLICQEPYNE